MYYLICNNEIVYKSEEKPDFGGPWSSGLLIQANCFQKPIYSNGKVIDGKTIEEIKQELKNSIDQKTRDTISNGFLYDGQIFSLSQNAQSNWQALDNWNMKGLLDPSGNPLPAVKIPTKDGASYLLMKSKINDFLAAAFATIQMLLNEGMSKKDDINSLTTLDQIKMYQDQLSLPNFGIK